MLAAAWYDQWGTVGEIVAAVGTFAAVVAALWQARKASTDALASMQFVVDDRHRKVYSLVHRASAFLRSALECIGHGRDVRSRRSGLLEELMNVEAAIHVSEEARAALAELPVAVVVDAIPGRADWQERFEDLESEMRITSVDTQKAFGDAWRTIRAAGPVARRPGSQQADPMDPRRRKAVREAHEAYRTFRTISRSELSRYPDLPGGMPENTKAPD
jgi:hypothetical protein